MKSRIVSFTVHLGEALNHKNNWNFYQDHILQEALPVTLEAAMGVAGGQYLMCS
jgi:hypothetical protein